MKVKTNELKGAQLDWAVAKCEGRTIVHDPMKLGRDSQGAQYWIWEETPSGKGGVDVNKSVYKRIGGKYSPSTNWAQGGPIIEREGMTVSFDMDGGMWCADVVHPAGDVFVIGHGTTPLVAAMRCYVASKLGLEIDIPDELVKAE